MFARTRTSARYALLAGLILLLGNASRVSRAQMEPLLSKLPPGVFRISETIVPANQRAAIGAKLNGRIDRLSNTVLSVHGRRIKVNVIAASDERQAEAIHNSLKKIKQFPFCLRSKNVVIEYVGSSLDEALAIKTSWEFGFLPKPPRVTYRVTMHLATIDQADYMACNPLFNQFLAAARKDPQATAQIKKLAEGFQFGKRLSLRTPQSAPQASTYSLQPAPSGNTQLEAAVRYEFAEPKRYLDIPYVSLTAQVATAEAWKTPGKPSKQSLAATPFWPADDASVRRLASDIVQGENTRKEKADAILAWLAPGKNVKYQGRTGSRWGVAKVLEQRFGHCWDFSDCFVTLCRASGVPCRQVAGWLYGSSGHVWAEYHDGEGWVQVDATGGGSLPCGLYHIPYFSSETGKMPIVYLAMPKIEVVAPKLR